MDDSKPDVSARINAIRARFVASLPAAKQTLEHQANRLRRLGWDADAARAARQVVHRLAGSGATFGFPEISRAAVPLDAALNARLADGAVPCGEELIVLARLFDDLSRVLADVDDAPADEASAVTPAGQKAPAGINACVVVIDDDPFLRARLMALLGGAGYRVRAFAEPESAFSFLQSEEPALVLLDLVFPGRERPAFDVVADIRSETGTRTPVVIMSAHGDFSSRLDAMRAGADGYIEKPLEDNALLAVVAQSAMRVTENWRCLVIDDDPLLAAEVCNWLSAAGMEVDWVDNPRESWLRVREFRPDIVLLDINMPECDGIELATLLREDTDTARLRVVFMTADASEATRRAAVAAGADDYLLKPLAREAVLHSVRSRARIGRRMTAQIGRVIRENEHGGGLARHAFFAELELALDGPADSDVQPALVLLAPRDVATALRDQGAIASATIAQQLTTRLATAGVDTWSLLGECMAGVLLPRATVAAHRKVLHDIARKIDATAFALDGVSVPSTVRAALLHLSRTGSVPARVALRQAEQLLGLALAGSDEVTEGFLGGTGTASEIVGRLPIARLRIAYQPIVTIDGTGLPVNAALVRLADKNGSGALLPAGKFLAQVEQRGWLPDLDAWMFREAHNILTSRLPAEQAMFLVVNVGTTSLASAIFVETVLAVLAEKPMRSHAQCLVLALPETAAVTHRGVVGQLADALRAAGCALMFTGYGGSPQSVAIAETFQPLFLRLDPVVATRLSQVTAFSPSDRTLVETANDINAGIVAGQVENARSLSALWSKGVRRFQGYFIQEPSATLEGTDIG